MSIEFTRTTTNYLRVGLAGGVTGQNVNTALVVTIAAWFFLRSHCASPNESRILSCAHGNTTTTAMTIGVRHDGLIYAGGRSYSGDNFQSVVGITPIGLNNWHHMVAVFDYAGDNIELYLDGQFENRTSVTFANTAYTHGTVSAAAYDWFGHPIEGSTTSTTITHDWDGYIADIALWGNKLSSAAVMRKNIVANQLYTKRVNPLQVQGAGSCYPYRSFDMPPKGGRRQGNSAAGTMTEGGTIPFGPNPPNTGMGIPWRSRPLFNSWTRGVEYWDLQYEAMAIADAMQSEVLGAVAGTLIDTSLVLTHSQAATVESNVTQDDTLAATDGFPASLVTLVNVTDAATLTEVFDLIAADIDLNIHDAGSITDLMLSLVQSNVDTADTFSITDALSSAGRQINTDTADLMTVATLFTSSAQWGLTRSDALAVADLLSGLIVGARTNTDSMSFLDVRHTTFESHRSNTDTVALSDVFNAAIGELVLHVVDDSSIDDLRTSLHTGRGTLSDTAAIADAVNAQIIGARKRTDPFTVGDVISAVGTANVNSSDALSIVVFFDVAAETSDVSVSDTSSIIDLSTAGPRSIISAFSDSLNISSQQSAQASYQVTRADVVVFTHTQSSSRIASVSVANVLALIDEVSAFSIEHGSLADTIEISDVAHITAAISFTGLGRRLIVGEKRVRSLVGKKRIRTIRGLR